ncbi:SRPBCC domain-containing protein [Parachlamydia sp. AcF125]|uniref:SRPBCC family protein n=1 Tax=Parachlamydia sp. AcF125 TaxID=2795736 RepID=UPI001BC9C68D|nr:SRPBCC domain-containing protein [Parachlamydia sp. AcF125]MBS4168728.1 hypothetical protein [Parachlamydia sp. AcF125]
MENKDFVIERTFNASRELLFKVWTEQKHIEKWFAPKGLTVQYLKFELKPNGVAHYYMSSPDGHKMYGKVVYKEISPTTKITYLQHFSDEKGGITSHPMSSTWPKSILTTVLFNEESENKTKITLTWTPVDASKEEMEVFVKAIAGMTQGWNGTFESLDGYLNEHSF